MQLSFLPFRIPFTCSDTVSLATSAQGYRVKIQRNEQRKKWPHKRPLSNIIKPENYSNALWLVFVFSLSGGNSILQRQLTARNMRNWHSDVSRMGYSNFISHKMHENTFNRSNYSSFDYLVQHWCHPSQSYIENASSEWWPTRTGFLLSF